VTSLGVKSSTKEGSAVGAAISIHLSCRGVRWGSSTQRPEAPSWARFFQGLGRLDRVWRPR
jgi:hypothetical protein